MKRARIVTGIVALALCAPLAVAGAQQQDPAPDTINQSGPPASSAKPEATFRFTASESGAVFECRFDAGAWRRCKSPAYYSNIPDGSHVLEVRALDQAGQPDPTPLSYTFVIKGGGAGGPVAGPTDPPAAPAPQPEPQPQPQPQPDPQPQPPPPPPPDTDPPSAAITAPASNATVRSRTIVTRKIRRNGKTRTVKRSKRRSIRLAGTVADQSGVRSVELALRLVRAVPCSWFDGRTSFVPKACTDPVFFRAKLSDTRWSFELPKSLRLARGTYELLVRATDGKGQTNSAFDDASRSRIRFKLK